MKIVAALVSLATVAHASPSGLRGLVSGPQLKEACASDGSMPDCDVGECYDDVCELFCLSTTECEPHGLICATVPVGVDVNINICIEKVALDQPCTHDSQCESGRCDSVCLEKVDEDGACDEDSDCASDLACAWDKCRTICTGTPGVCGTGMTCDLYEGDPLTGSYACVESEPEVVASLCNGVECASGEICGWEMCVKDCTGTPEACGEGFGCIDTTLDASGPYGCMEQLMGPGLSFPGVGSDPILIYKAGEGGDCTSSTDCEAGLICADLKCEAVGNSN